MAYKFNDLVTAHLDSLDPTCIVLFCGHVIDDNDATIITSNRSPQQTAHPCYHGPPPTAKGARRLLFGDASHEQLNALTIATTHAIADIRATSIFIMDGVDVVNKRVATNPLRINLPDGRQVKSTHTCDIDIPGLPTVLTGHVVPHLAVASLIGIRPLCKEGCIVTFDNDKCNVSYNGKIILRGLKDPASDLWTLSINPKDMRTTLSRSSHVFGRAPHDPLDAPIHPAVDLANFTHSIKTRANGVKFAHQSLCSPRILTLLKMCYFPG